MTNVRFCNRNSNYLNSAQKQVFRKILIKSKKVKFGGSNELKNILLTQPNSLPNLLNTL